MFSFSCNIFGPSLLPYLLLVGEVTQVFMSSTSYTRIRHLKLLCKNSDVGGSVIDDCSLHRLPKIGRLLYVRAWRKSLLHRSKMLLVFTRRLFDFFIFFFALSPSEDGSEFTAVVLYMSYCMSSYCDDVKRKRSVRSFLTLENFFLLRQSVQSCLLLS